MWPNFRSPLLWDVFAVSTYATVSLLFWYVGMIPDLATLRDRATTRDAADRLRDLRPGLARLGPALAPLREGLPAAGRAGDPARAERALRGQLRLRRLAVLPGWHTTIFPPYFVAGAIFGGFAMVLC
jgi:Ni/Fe-hydrogenase subunit HybB-like protein